MSTYDIAGRIQFLNAGQLLQPAVCALCQSGHNEEGYADPGIDIEYHGQIYFCKTCAMELAMFWGAVTPEEYTRVCADRDNYEQAMEKFRSQLEQYQHIESFIADRALSYSESTEPVTTDGPVFLSPPTEVTSTEGSQDSTAGTEQSVATESGEGIRPDDTDELAGVNELLGLTTS